MSEESKKEAVKAENAGAKETGHETQTGAKPKKKRLWLRVLGWTLGVIAVLLIVAIIARDAIIKTAVTKIGSAVTGTKVEMDSFSSSFGGTVELTGFRVANPEGYRDPYAFQVAQVRVGVDVGSLFSDKIEVREVLISGTKVNFELKLNGSSNLTDIKQNVETFAGEGGGQPESPDQPATQEPEAAREAAQKKVVIRIVKVEGTELSVSSSLLNTTVPLPLPPITLTDLGEGKNFGETVNEFAAKMLAAILTAVSDSGLRLDGLKGIGDSLTEAGKGLGDSLKQSGDSLKDAGKTLESSFKDLFKNKK